MKRIIILQTITRLIVLLLPACKTVQTATDTTLNHTANNILRDSIYLHDSIRVEYRRGYSLHRHNLRTEHKAGNEGNPLPHTVRIDTVYLEKWHTRWRDRETIKTDTLTNEVIRTETVQVRYVPRFYKYCTALAIILFLICLLRVTLYLYRRFH